MLKELVKVGSYYTARINGNYTVVQILREHERTSYGLPGRRAGQKTAWIARNLKTGREILIKSAAKLRQEATPTEVARARGEVNRIPPTMCANPLTVLREAFELAQLTNTSLQAFKIGVDQYLEDNHLDTLTIKDTQQLLAASLLRVTTQRWSKAIQSALAVLHPLVYPSPIDPPSSSDQARHCPECEEFHVGYCLTPEEKQAKDATNVAGPE